MSTELPTVGKACQLLINLASYHDGHCNSLDLRESLSGVRKLIRHQARELTANEKLDQLGWRKVKVGLCRYDIFDESGRRVLECSDALSTSRYCDAMLAARANGGGKGAV